jgi:hypothetical protein
MAVKFYVFIYSLFNDTLSSRSVTRKVHNSVMNWKECESKSTLLNFRH